MRQSKIVITSVDYGQMSLQELAQKWTELFAHHQDAQKIVGRSGAPAVPPQSVQSRNVTSSSSQTEDGGTR